MSRAPALRGRCLLAFTLSAALSGSLEAQARIIETPNVRPARGSPGRVDTLMIRPNAAPDTASETAILTDLAVDSGGHILALDAGAQRLIVLDSSGRVTGVIGRAGAGPGEFRLPYLVTVVANGTVIVLDERLDRLTLFDLEHRFLRTVPLPGHMNSSSMVVLGDVLFVAGTLNLSGAENKAIHAISLAGEHLRSFGRLVDAAHPAVRRAIGGGILTPARGGGLWYTQRAPYLIERYAPDGTLEVQIRRPNDFLPSAEAAFPVQLTETRTVFMAPRPFARAVAIQELANGMVVNQTVLPSGEVVTDLFRPTGGGLYRLASSHLHTGSILLRRGPSGRFLGLVPSGWNTNSGVLVVRFTPQAR